MTKTSLYYYKMQRCVGLEWLGDGTTIKLMNLLNILVLCGNTPPTVVFIVDCTSHMSDGGKENSTNIMNQFWRKMNEIDADKKLTNCSFFDGTSNFQTAGAILCATYRQAMYFHGGENILYLFFSDLSNFKPILVSSIFFAFYFKFFLTYFSVTCCEVL